MPQAKLQLRSTNPLVRVLALVLLAVLFLVGLMIGTVVFLALLGIAVIGAVAMSLRLWWLRRSLYRGRATPRSQTRGQASSRTIEGEVVERREKPADDDRR